MFAERVRAARTGGQTRLTFISLRHHRYPSFPDALRDLDDALSLIILFAHLPASEKIPAAVIANCSKLAAEWQLYVMRTHSLKKVFLSIKGIYFQAQVKGETITWLVPYMFTQNVRLSP